MEQTHVLWRDEITGNIWVFDNFLNVILHVSNDIYNIRWSCHRHRLNNERGRWFTRLLLPLEWPVQCLKIEVQMLLILRAAKTYSILKIVYGGRYIKLLYSEIFEKNHFDLILNKLSYSIILIILKFEVQYRKNHNLRLWWNNIGIN